MLKGWGDYALPHRKFVALLHRAIIQKVKDGEQFYLLLLAILVGLVMGGVCAGFRYLILISHHFFFEAAYAGEGSQLQHVVTPLRMIIRALLPGIGGLVVGLVIYRILKLSGGHGVPSVIKAVATGHVNLNPGMAIKSSSSIVTITSGGSGGPEGPIIEIGSVIGSMIGREAQVSKERIGTLIGCGAAAGISGIFNAPIGGVFIALELLMRDFSVRVFGPVVLASVVASVTSESILPNSPVFPRIADSIIESASLNPPGFIMFLLLGILCGGGGALMVFSLYRMHDLFQSWKFPIWLKPAVGGLCVGLVGLAFPTVLGEGYEFVRQDILAEFATDQAGGVLSKAAFLFLFVALVKILVTSLTLGSGGTAGAFAPAMVIGALFGAGFGAICNIVSPGFAATVPVFALVGMAGTTAAALHIPIASFFIIYEVSGARYELILPLMLTVAASAIVSSLLRQGSVYTLPLLRDGFDVEEVIRTGRDPLRRVPVRKIMHADFVRVGPNDNLKQMIDAFSASDEDAFAVVDEADQLLGMVSTNDLRGVLNLGGVGEAIIAQDAADPNPSVLYPDSLASEAMEIFGSSSVMGVPVLARPGSKKIVGMVSRVDILAAYREAGAARPLTELGEYVQRA